MLIEVVGHIQCLAAVGLMSHFLAGENPLLFKDSHDEVWSAWLLDVPFLDWASRPCHLTQLQHGSEIHHIHSGRGNIHAGMYTG